TPRDAEGQGVSEPRQRGEQDVGPPARPMGQSEQHRARADGERLPATEPRERPAQLPLQEAAEERLFSEAGEEDVRHGPGPEHRSPSWSERKLSEYKRQPQHEGDGGDDPWRGAPQGLQPVSAGLKQPFAEDAPTAPRSAANQTTGRIHTPTIARSRNPYV